MPEGSFAYGFTSNARLLLFPFWGVEPIEYPGAFYHLMAQGNRRGRIFCDDDDRHYFLKTLGEAGGMTGWRVHGWVLMSSHDHVFVETPEANLVAGMQWMQNA